MTAAKIIAQAAEDGVELALSTAGTFKAGGNQAAVNRWLPLVREHKPGIVEALQEAANEATSRGWLLHFPDRNPAEVYFSPAATRAEALTAYPGAVAAEPVADRPRRRPTSQETAELSQLVTLFYANDRTVDREEALALGLADVDAALICYRALAKEMSQ